MPVIQYPQLENELFCNVFYLRHLCDTQKFPDWPIKEPVSSLKHAYISTSIAGWDIALGREACI